MRAAAYIRESTEEQGNGFSPDAQRGAIFKFAQDNKLEVVKEYMDLQTGTAVAKREGFQTLISDAMDKRFDVVLIFHTSRFARNTIEAKKYKKLLRQKLGIDVVSVTQRFGDHHDPSAFLNESINEIFDEHYSINLSFWTKMGLKEKAKQGFLTGSLPFGYTKEPTDNRKVIQDPERAPIIIDMFQKYATGKWSDKSMAEYLNTQGVRTLKSNLFGKDSVREILVNSAYCGFVSPRRSKSREILGKHEAIIDIELFDRVQHIRKMKAVSPNPPKNYRIYLLSGLLYCKACGSKMQGQTGSNKGIQRYYCSNHRRGLGCDQKMVKAEVFDAQIVDFLSGFELPKDIIEEILKRLANIKRTELKKPYKDSYEAIVKRLERVRDLYEMGDLTKSQYLLKKQMLEGQLTLYRPVPAADIQKAAELLGNFSGFWQQEKDPREKQSFLRLVFSRIYAENGRITAVQPHDDIIPFFRHLRGVSCGSDGI